MKCAYSLLVFFYPPTHTSLPSGTERARVRHHARKRPPRKHKSVKIKHILHFISSFSSIPLCFAYSLALSCIFCFALCFFYLSVKRFPHPFFCSPLTLPGKFPVREWCYGSVGFTRQEHY